MTVLGTRPRPQHPPLPIRSKPHRRTACPTPRLYFPLMLRVADRQNEPAPLVLAEIFVPFVLSRPNMSWRALLNINGT